MPNAPFPAHRPSDAEGEIVQPPHSLLHSCVKTHRLRNPPSVCYGAHAVPQALTFTPSTLTAPYSSFSSKAQGQMSSPGPVLTLPTEDEQQHHSWHHCSA